MNTEKHIGQNIRKIRLLRGMKQSTFAKEMGIAQQNISKMEKKNKVSDEQLEKVAKVLKASVDAIKDFDDRVIINNNVFSNDQINHPITEVVKYFKEELYKRDEEITKLKDELAKKSNSNTKAKSTEAATTPLRKVKEG